MSRDTNNKKKKRNEGGFVSSCAVDIDAPPDVVWKMIVDVESAPQLFSRLDAVENLTPRKGPLNPVVPGVVFRQIGTFAGKPVTFDCSVTIVDHEKMVFGSATYFGNCTANNTVSVESLQNNKSRLSVLYSFVPDGCRGKLFLWLFGWKLLQQANEGMSSDFPNIKSFAEKRFNGGAKTTNEG